MLRKEHPRPVFKRNNWLNLNGKWSCEFSKNIKGFSKSQLNKNNCLLYTSPSPRD